MPNQVNQSAGSGDVVVALLEGSNDGFCALDGAGRLLYANSAAERILGATRDALVGRGAIESFGEHARQLRRAADENLTVDFRFKSRALDEWFDVRACPSGGSDAAGSAGRGLSVHLRLAAAAAAARNANGEGAAAADGALNDASADVLAAIGEAAPDFVWVTNEVGDVLYVNRRWIEYTGLTPAETDRRGYVRTIHPVDLPRFLNEVEYAQRDGRALEGEFRYRRHDGEYRWFWVRSTPLKDRDGNLRRRVGVAVDITERIEATRAVRESEQRYRGIFDQAAVGMSETVLGQGFTAVNQRFCDMLGYTREELLARAPLDITHPDDVPESRAQIGRLIAREADSFVVDKRYVRKDGAVVWAHTSVSAIRDEHGRCVRLVAASQDITEQKRLEAERQRSEQLTQHIVEHSPIGIMLVDTAGRFMHVNDAWLNMLGYTMADVRGGAVNWKDMTVPEHRHLDERAIEQVRSTGAHPPFEKTLIRKDGSRVPVLAATAYLGGPGETGVAFLVDLTDVKRAQQQVQDSEQRLQAIIDSVAASVYVKDADGRYLLINRHFTESVGIDPVKMIGLTDYDFFAKDDADKYRGNDVAVLESGRAMQFEEVARHADGPHTYVSVKFPLRDADGGIYAVCGVSTDINERKQAEQALREREDQLRLITNAAPALISYIDRDYHYRLVNQTYERLFGRGVEEIRGRHVRELLGDDGFARVKPNLDRALGGEEVSYEHCLSYPRGGPRWMSVSYTPDRDAAGDVRGIVMLGHDVTEQRRAGEELRASEERYRSLFESSRDGIVFAEMDGRLVSGNGALQQITGYPQAELAGLRYQDLTPAKWHAMEERVLREQIIPRGYSDEYEKEYRRKDGSVVPISLRVWLDRDAAGNPVGMWAIVRDITERKRAEEAVLAAKAEAEHANKAKDQFLAVLSHELRTPLTPVVMTVAAMEMDRTLSPQLRDDLAMIRRNIELETKLIDDLLDVTRIANGKLRLQARASDVHALLRNVLEILKSDVGEKRLNVAVELDAADAGVFADPARLQQVFWNLIKNAIKFTPSGGHVTVKSWNPSPRLVCVEVIDTGAGIEPSVLPRIFNAFDQGEQTITRQFGGLGLGLAISKALTELHGGTIRAESDGKGRGARFTLELPTRTPVERLVDQIQPLGPAADGAPRPRVLLVEDHLDTQRTLRRLLEDRGYEVVTASSVAAALSVLSSATTTPIDVLVSDIGLPDSTGHELMRTVRATYELPGIAVSGFGMDGDLKSSHDAGFAAHMTKPVDIQQLDTMIRSLLPNSRRRAVEEAEA